MTSPEQNISEKRKRGEPITMADTLATISSEVELEQFRIGLDQRGALDARALNLIAVRRHDIRKTKGVRQ